MRSQWCLVVGAFVLFTLYSFFYIDKLSLQLLVPNGEKVWIWSNKYRTFLVLFLTIALPVAAHRYFSSGKCLDSFNDQLRVAMLPLLFLPYSISLAIIQPFVPYAFSANILLYFPIFLFSLVFYRLLSSDEKKTFISQWSSKRLFMVVVVIMSLFYWITGCYFTAIAGAHSGDEGHYIIQAESLYYDHDLDILNNFDSVERKILERRGKEYLHVSGNSRNGHFYSWHPFGLSFLMAFAVPGGIVGRHLVLGVLAGLGCGAMVLLCDLLGVRRRLSLIFCGLFWGSMLWGIFASRALPETAGAMFAMFLVVSVLGVKQNPWFSLIGATVCCFALPWLHVRFLPVSAIGACFFLFNAYRYQKNLFWKRIVPLFVVSAVFVGGAYIAVQYFLFDSGSGYDVSGFFDNPSGMIHYLGGEEGMVAVYPMLFLSLWVAIWTIFFHRENRLVAILVLTIFFATLVVSCSSHSFIDGAALKGRMLLVAVPLFVPLVASFFGKASRVNRFLFVFFSVLPVLTFFLVLVYLPQIKRDFAMPYQVLPIFSPFLRVLSNPFSNEGIFGSIFFLISFLLIFSEQSREQLHFVLICLLLSASFYFAQPSSAITDLSTGMKKENTRLIARADCSMAKIWSTGKILPERLFDTIFFNRLGDYNVTNTPVVTTEKIYDETDSRVVVQNQLQPNDWQGRGYKWVPLVKPFTVSEKPAIFCMSAEKVGETQVSFSLAELVSSEYKPLAEKEVTFNSDGIAEQCYSLETKGNGKIHILARLYGEPGSLYVKSLYWFPGCKKLLAGLNLTLPFQL